MSQSPDTVYIVDDDPSVRRSFSRLMRSADLAVQAFASAEEFLATFTAPDHPACAVLDLIMPGIDGLELQRRMARHGTQLPIVFLSANGDIPSTVKAMQQGALTFLTKPVNDEELLRAIRQGLARHRYQLAASTRVQGIRDHIAVLSEREREIMSFMITGAPNKQIAACLGIMEQTVKVHRSRVFEKMETHNVAELVRLCTAAGFSAARLPD
ncbi:MAG: chemotaxis protein CheY [Verrucomicrobiales bacterium]|nr:chemotaxis protein CheY [Verrucomicrobiales bacterium]